MSKNTNCLEGFKCPSCGWTEDFIIHAKSMFRVTDDGAENQGDVGWDEDTLCICGKCPHHGTVKEFTAPPLPPDPEGQNGDRARWAGAALELFMKTTGCDLEDSLGDLLADLRHWADRNGFDWQLALDRAMGHYAEETEELDPNTDAIDREENQ